MKEKAITTIVVILFLASMLSTAFNVTPVAALHIVDHFEAYFDAVEPIGESTYDVTIDAYCYTEAASVSVHFKMDGKGKPYATPYTFTGLAGTHTFTVPNKDPSGHPFYGWSTGETSRTITVSSGGAFTAYYGTSYDVTIDAYCNIESASVSVNVTMDGTPTGYNTPHTFTGLIGTHTFTVPNRDQHFHRFYKWSTGETGTTITVSSGGAFTAYYGILYNVTIKAHCYTEAVDVSVSITMDGSPTGYATPYTFTGLAGTHTFTVPNEDPSGHPFCGWSTGETSTTITVSSGGAFTAYYGISYGPKIDVLRILTITSPDDQLTAIKTGVVDMLPDLIRPADIEDLGAQTPAYTVTDAPGFHMGHIGFNLRKPVMNDVAFRHACLHAYPQDDIIASIYEYTVTPVRSLVPPAQTGWVNPAIPTHPYNHGDMGDAPGTESFFGIMYAAGYTYYGTGYGDLGGYWLTPGGDPIPAYVLWTPTYEVAPTSAEHGARIMDEWHRCGLNTLVHTPADFNWYTGKVFNEQDFDMYMMFWSLDRFPDQLYSMCHSSQDSPGVHNAPGIHDPVLDPWLETLKFSLDHEAKLEAAMNAQAWLYNEENPWAFPYLQMYSRVYFNAYRPELAGIINSDGYGSDNDWTLYNIHWETPDGLRPETGDNMVIYCNGETVASLNPLQASTPYEWNVISPTMSSLIQVNPYTHKDLEWIATDWTIEGPWSGTAPNGVPIVDGMKVTYELRTDVFWQDGNPFTAHDAEFSLEFIRDNMIPRYTDAWEHIVDVDADTDYSFTVYSEVTGQFYLYDWAALATLLPPQVWACMDGAPLPEILGYEIWNNATDTGPWSYPDGPDGIPNTPDDPDPTNPGPKYCLFGTGPMVFQGWDPVGMVADLTRFEGWFKTTYELEQMTVDMFHAAGDCAPPDYDHRTDPAAFDGDINDDDQTVMSLSFGYFDDEPEYAPHADIDEDGFVGGSDTCMMSFFYGRRREYGPST